MKTIKYNTRSSISKLLILTVILAAFSQCRRDDDENFRILIENNCDFAVKVYYDNQDIEYYDDGYDKDVIGAVTFIPPYSEKVVHSKYTSVWVEPEFTDIRSRKFRSTNDGPFRKKVIIYESDFFY